MIRRLLVAVIGLLVIFMLVVREAVRLWELPLNIPERGYILSIEPGATLQSIAQQLHGDGVLAHPELFVFVGRVTGMDRTIKQGEYFVPSFVSAAYLLELFDKGRVVEYQVTFPEGITLHRALDILRQQRKLSSTLDDPNDARILEIVSPYRHPEGLFFPDSYRYTRGATDESILRRSHQKLLDVLDAEWRNRAPALPYDSAYEALILASVVERETGLPDERGKIAGVFVRRLELGMRLQTDPTVIYGLGNTFDGNLKRAHLQDKRNTYNTYQHSGLPPTPIALAGRAAIHAVLHPESGDELYFVARGDGGHHFSADLVEHERAVRKYQLNRRQQYRSTPGQQQ